MPTISLGIVPTLLGMSRPAFYRRHVDLARVSSALCRR
ncbi:putative leader peptide [Tenggerimyces flavus]|uniref:Leader peptide n=1 Tax=Tenggerimyces flavus TaxID=1708749 RepID=A0ABV7YD12_9ACTN